MTPQIDRLWKKSTVLRVSTHIYGFFEKIDGKPFIFQVNLGKWPFKSIILEKQALFWGFQHTSYGVSKEIDGKTFILRVTLGMWPLKSIISEKRTLFWGFEQTFMGFFSGDRRENVHFESKPRHVTPQIDCLRKASTVLRVSTHIYWDSEKIDGKTYIFQVNLSMLPLKLIVLEKQALFWGSEHTFILRR